MNLQYVVSISTKVIKTHDAQIKSNLIENLRAEIDEFKTIIITAFVPKSEFQQRKKIHKII